MADIKVSGKISPTAPKLPKTRITKYWETLKHTREVYPQMVLPDNHHANDTALELQKLAEEEAANATKNSKKSYEVARQKCYDKVEQIAQNCIMNNRRYRDQHFDLTADKHYCLEGLSNAACRCVGAVRRVPDIFDEPRFYRDGAGAGDIRQGIEGDCWFLAAVAAITNIPNMIDKICVHRNEKVGVYGFVFQRDGEWHSTVIDDQLMLHLEEERHADTFKKQHLEKIYEKGLKGSDALKFASCEDQNETWLPLLEKAYAKAHGDYAAISGGWFGEAVEDLTGGVSTSILCQDIMDKDRFWTEELMQVNKTFLFGASMSWGPEDKGLVGNHAYSVLRAVEAKGKRFVLVRNPWGKWEWKGPWSDGSSEWTVEWIEALQHKFGDDGSFWMLYTDFLKHFNSLDRTRLFDESWYITQKWVSVNPTWLGDYSDTRYQITIKKKTRVVIMLSQLDDRYFVGLRERYTFKLFFRVQKADKTNKVVGQHFQEECMDRSVVTEIDMEPGKYNVLFKVEVNKKEDAKSLLDIVKEHSISSRKKFMQIGLSHDLAYAKGFAEAERKRKMYLAREERKKKRAEEIKALNEGIEKVKAKQQEAKEKAEKEAAEKKARAERMTDKGIGPDDEPEAPKDGEPDEKKDTESQEKKDAEVEVKGEEQKPEEKKEESKDQATSTDEVKDEEAKQDDKDAEPKPLKKSVTFISSSRPDIKPVHRSVSFPAPRREEHHVAEDPESESESEDENPQPGDYESAPVYGDAPDANVAVQTEPVTVEDTEEPDEEDNWEPVCVVGLRVYSQDPDLILEVLHPDTTADDKLDIDDEQRDAADQKSPAPLKRAKTWLK